MTTTLLITKDRSLFHRFNREHLSTATLTYTESLDSVAQICQQRRVELLIIDSETILFNSIDAFEKSLKGTESLQRILLYSTALSDELIREMERMAISTAPKESTLSDLIEIETTSAESTQLPDSPVSEEDLLLKLMGGSPAMEKIARLVMKVAPSSATIMLGGENGTGKEYFSTIIHKLSKVDGRFVPVNCGAIPDTLFESELFGHKKGSFTGADRDRVGLVEEAENGTLFLDEVGELSLHSQVKLLRFLQESKYKPVGESSERHSTSRIIVATNRDLRAMVKEGTFREDLFYRLHVFPMTLPPLRERKEMIPQLVELFLHTFGTKMKKKFTGITPEAEFLLSQQRYSGNIRELQNCIEYAAIMATPPKVTANDLPEYVKQLPGLPDQHPISLSIGYESGENEYQSPEDISLENRFCVSEQLTLAELEERYMRYILEKCDNNHSEAAKILGVSRSTLWRKLKED